MLLIAYSSHHLTPTFQHADDSNFYKGSTGNKWWIKWKDSDVRRMKKSHFRDIIGSTWPLQTLFRYATKNISKTFFLIENMGIDFHVSTDDLTFVFLCQVNLCFLYTNIVPQQCWGLMLRWATTLLGTLLRWATTLLQNVRCFHLAKSATTVSLQPQMKLNKKA